jgi:hypothetical protein
MPGSSFFIVSMTTVLGSKSDEEGVIVTSRMDLINGASIRVD